MRGCVSLNEVNPPAPELAIVFSLCEPFAVAVPCLKKNYIDILPVNKIIAPWVLDIGVFLTYHENFNLCAGMLMCISTSSWV